MALVGICAPTAAALDLSLGERSVLRFAEVREGVAALTQRDDYIRQLSAFDRQVRLKTDHDVSEQQLLDSIAGNVLPWQPAEIERLTPLVTALAEKLTPWKLKLPGVVLLVKTSGREEANAAYCRGAAIALPQRMVDNRRGELTRTLPHEVFHVLSSHNPELREALYRSIGFQPCNEVALPEALRARKITNPDAPVNDHLITLQWQGRAVEMMPVLFSKTERYDMARGGDLFSYLTFRLMVLEREGETRRPAVHDAQPVMVEPASVPDFAAQVGSNTRYLIHPEEILADNFVLLVSGRIDVPTPRIVQQMGRILQEAADSRGQKAE